MTPLQAIMETIVDELGAALSLKRHSQIDLRHDEKVNAVCGDVFVGVFSSSLVDGPSPDPQMGIDHAISVNVSVTQRTGFAPDDKMMREAAFHTDKGILAFTQRIIREMQIRRVRIPRVAQGKLEPPYAGQFVEPLRLTSNSAAIRAVDYAHFHSQPPKDEKQRQQMRSNPQDFGLTTAITFGGMRYMENVIAQTVAATEAV